MAEPSHPAIYERIGRGYANYRTPDPRIQTQIDAALGGARRICNIGAGAGSYEPEGREIVAVEPSLTMIRQRSGRTPALRAVAEALPFPDSSFDAALVVLSLHHWLDREAGVREVARVAPRRVFLAFVPEGNHDFWLVRDYLPESADENLHTTPSIERVIEWLGGGRSEVIPVPWDCQDGFMAAYWRRPEHYLDPRARAAISTLAQLPPSVVERGMRKLEEDLRSGRWRERNAELLERESMDYGYRLIVSGA